MGAWGYGNLESDGAQDTLANICEELFARVMALLQHPRAHEYDDEEIDELFVRIEMIFALHARGMITSGPNPELLEPLFAPYLARYAEYNAKSGSHGPPEERIRVIEETFRQLLQIAKGATGGSFAHRVGLISEKMESSQPNEPETPATEENR